MIGVSPLLAPRIGSAIVAGLGWRWIFGLLASIASAILALMFFLLPEGHQPDHSVSLRPGPIANGFWAILKDPQFLTYSLAGAFSFAGLFAFVAGSPIIFMDGYHMGTKTFGIVFAVLVMGFVGGNQLNVLLLRWFTSQQIFFAALLVQVAIGAVFYLGMRNQVLGLISTLVSFFFFLSCIGLTYPNAAALGLARFSRDAGRASAWLGFLQTGTGALISMGIGPAWRSCCHCPAFLHRFVGARNPIDRKDEHTRSCCRRKCRDHHDALTGHQVLRGIFSANASREDQRIGYGRRSELTPQRQLSLE
jgi:DHA1 family bicyclomycin/chloramphenicol resistance-like MFS transporter